MAVTSRLYLLLYLEIYLILDRCKGNVYQNFSCVTYNWDEYLICSWAVSPQYNKPNYTTVVKWAMPPFCCSPCPELSSNSCKWPLTGGPDAREMYIDPYQQIRVCLQLLNGNNTTESEECHKVDIQNKVKPGIVSELRAKPQYPNCIFAQWTHQKVEPSKIYSVEISSPGMPTIREDLPLVSIYDYTDSSDLDSGVYTNFTRCNLSYYNNYTLSVAVRAVDIDDNQVGYWSDSLAVHVVTPKTIPSGAVYLPPGGYTLSPVSDRGQRLARIYWTDLPKYAWNGETITYDLEANPDGDCRSGTVRLQSRETSAEFHVMYTCSYTIKVWASNEIGRSKDFGVLLMKQDGSPKPSEVLMTPGESESVTISWLKPDGVVPPPTYTVYWCPKSPSRSCRKSFNYKTVTSPISSDDVYFRSTILMAGYPNVTYMYGVSADLQTSGSDVSSGFVWTDCTMLSTEKLKNPRISFKGYPSEGRVRISWLYLKCAAAMIRHSNSVQYSIKHCSSGTCEELTSGSSQTYVDLHSISTGQEVCVTITIRLDTVTGPPSNIHCYTQPVQGAPYPLHAVLVALVVISGVVLVVIIGGIWCAALKWWRKPTNCSIPTIPSAISESDQSTGERLIVNEGSTVSSGRATADTETPLIINK